MKIKKSTGKDKYVKAKSPEAQKRQKAAIIEYYAKKGQKTRKRMALVKPPSLK